MHSFKVNNADVTILEITPSSVVQMAIRRTLISTCGIVLVLSLWSMWVQDSPSLTIVVMAIVGLGVVPWYVFHEVSRAAHNRRADMNMAVAVFLDLVNVLLAGGAGIETAILTAASAGDGWSFDYIRRTLARAQSSRENYWDALDQAGGEIEVQSLQNVAQSIRIAGEHGGRIRQSLTSRADALRKNNLAFIEHEAQRRTERMGIPMVAMFVGFVVFIGYPAFVTTVTAL